MKAMLGSRKSLSILLAAIFILGACRGPNEPLEVVEKTIPTDVVLGRRVAAAVPGLSEIIIEEIFVNPMPFAPSLGFDRPRGPVSFGFCPPADPLAVPATEARNVITKAPKEAEYPYHGIGFTAAGIGGQEPKIVQYPLTHLRKIQTVLLEPTGSFTYEMRVDYGENRVTTYRYRVVPEGVATPGYPTPPPPEVGADPKGPTRVQPGLYLLSITTPDSAFRLPEPGILFMQLPIVQGQKFATEGTDGNTFLKFTSVVGSRDRVNACGTLLDVWNLELKDLVFAEVDKRSAFANAGGLNLNSIKFKIGPQYGGLILEEQISLFGAEGFNPLLLPGCAGGFDPNQDAQGQAVLLALCSSGGLALRQINQTISVEPQIP